MKSFQVQNLAVAAVKAGGKENVANNRQRLFDRESRGRTVKTAFAEWSNALKRLCRPILVHQRYKQISKSRHR